MVGASAMVAPVTLKGFYTLRGVLEDLRGHYISLSGSLDFDWLGDISGEGSLHEHSSSGNSCHVLMKGTYESTKDPLVLVAKITLVPVYGHCSEELDGERNWTISITRGKPGVLVLSQNLASERWFAAVGTRPAVKLS